MKYQSIKRGQVFNDYFIESANIIDFQNDEEEDAYETRDSEFIEVIKNACSKTINIDQIEYVEHLEDWWPNHTRYVYLGSKYLNKQFLESLQNLIKSPYENYRIQVVIGEEKVEGEELGSLIIEKKKIIYEDSLEKTIMETI